MSRPEGSNFIPGFTRAQNVGRLERGFVATGDSDIKAFRRAIVHTRLMEGGATAEQAEFLESAIVAQLRLTLFHGLGNLRSQRDTRSA